MEMKQEKGIHLLSETKISHQMTLLRGLELCNCLGEELSGNVSRQRFFFSTSRQLFTRSSSDKCGYLIQTYQNIKSGNLNMKP